MRPIAILLLWGTAAIAADPYIPTPLPNATRPSKAVAATITTPAAAVPAPPREDDPTAGLVLEGPKPKQECHDGACDVTPPAGPTVSIACPDLVQAGDLVTPRYVNDRIVHHAGLWWYRQSNPGDPARWLRQAAPGSRSWTQHRDPEPTKAQPQPATAGPCSGGVCPQPDAAEFWAPRWRRR